MIKQLAKIISVASISSLFFASTAFAKDVSLPGTDFFPEGTAYTSDGTLFAGSMKHGSIYKIAPGSDAAELFISPGSNGLVSVLGMVADEGNNTLYACSSDASSLGYGISNLAGTNRPGIKAFDLTTGAPKGSYDFPPGDIPGYGFCNDLALDDKGNVYATDSWNPRILRLENGATELVEWFKSDQLGAGIWQLNGLVFDPSTSDLYVLNQKQGRLFRIEVFSGGTAGFLKEIKLSEELKSPDGLKLLGEGTLGTAEAGSGEFSTIELFGEEGDVSLIASGMNSPATFALYKNKAYVAESQGGSFWCGPADCSKPKSAFRLVEVRLN